MTGMLAVLSEKGDTKTIWDSDNADEVAAAKKQFDDLRAKGFLAFKVKKDGDKGDLVTTFDPTAEKYILTPPVRGG